MNEHPENENTKYSTPKLELSVEDALWPDAYVLRRSGGRAIGERAHFFALSESRLLVFYCYRPASILAAAPTMALLRSVFRTGQK